MQAGMIASLVWLCEVADKFLFFDIYFHKV